MNGILLLIHPGSLCGSAEMNLGFVKSARVRLEICDDIDDWEGAFAVLDSMMSDEIERYGALHDAISSAMERARKNGERHARAFGCDCENPGIEEGVDELLKLLGAEPAKDIFSLTGAWFDPSRTTGCVTWVEKLLIDRGFKVKVLRSAAVLDD